MRVTSRGEGDRGVIWGELGPLTTPTYLLRGHGRYFILQWNQFRREWFRNEVPARPHELPRLEVKSPQIYREIKDGFARPRVVRGPHLLLKGVGGGTTEAAPEVVLQGADFVGEVDLGGAPPEGEGAWGDEGSQKGGGGGGGEGREGGEGRGRGEGRVAHTGESALVDL